MNLVADISKIPPQAIDIEEALLGICLSYSGIANGLKLKADMFYKDVHKKIFQTLTELKNNSSTISVTNKLRDKGELEAVGGIIYITKLTDGVYSDSMAEYYAAIIREKYMRREYIKLSSYVIDKSFDESFDLSDLIELAENGLFNISDLSQLKEPEHISKSVDEVLIDVEQIQSKEKSLIGIPSGFTNVDRTTGGWQPSNLYIIAGRPSMGKTAFILDLAKFPTRLKIPVAIFSLEMSRKDLTIRMMSGESNYSNIQIRNAEVNLDNLASRTELLSYLPIYIDDTPAISIPELRSKVKKLILKYGVKLIFVDYLQLMTGSGQSREQEVSFISRGLKAIAKEFDIPVIAVSQLNRDVEKTRSKMPGLADLRESGAIEQDADFVGFVFRPAYYDMKDIDVNGSNMSSQGLMLFYAGKNRNGALFMEPLYHNEFITKISDAKTEPSPVEADRF